MDLEANTVCFQQVNTALPLHDSSPPMTPLWTQISSRLPGFQEVEGPGADPLGVSGLLCGSLKVGGAMQWESPLSDLQKDGRIGALNVTHSHLCTLFRQSHSVQ